MTKARKPQGEGPIDDDGTLFDYYTRRREQRIAREDEREARGEPRRPERETRDGG